MGLPLEDAGFHYSVLSKFRRRLLAGGAEERLFTALLTVLKAKDLLQDGGQQRSDSTHILGAIRKLNRLELVGATLRQALNKLALVVPTWVQTQVPAIWFERYGEPLNSYRISQDPAEQAQFALTMGQDGVHLLQMIAADPEYGWLQNLPAVITLWRVWVQQYGYDENGEYRWRANKETPPATHRIVSPYDVEARQGVKRATKWLGYKVHLTETCDAEAPKLITHVETRIACQQDAQATATIHQALAEKELTPAQHVVDTSYVSGSQLVASQATYQIDLLGPVPPDTSWQTQVEGAYDMTQFVIAWDQQQVTCPQGKQNRYWHTGVDGAGKPIIAVTFSRKDCGPCPVRAQLCTHIKKHGRKLTLRPQAEHEAMQARRQYQQTEAFKKEYARRAGVEGLNSQATHALDMRRTRYRGLAKTHFQHLATATAVNLKRAIAWLLGIPSASTQISPFAALAPG